MTTPTFRRRLRVRLPRRRSSVWGVAPLPPVGRKPAMTLTELGAGGLHYDVPYAPVETVQSGFTSQSTISERAGRIPLLRMAGINSAGLRTFDLTFIVAKQDPQQDVEQDLSRLRDMARRGRSIKIEYDFYTATRTWKITDMTITAQARTTLHQISRADVKVTFTESSDAVVHTGPVNPPPKAPPKPPPAPGQSQGHTHHTVKRGETLSKIAAAHLGNAQRYPEIARLNGIRNPNRIRVGQVLKIPRK